MSEHQRSHEGSPIDCPACDVPFIRTGDDAYVCPACGSSLHREPDFDPSTTARTGVEVTCDVVDRSEDERTIRYTVHSDRDEPVMVRIEDTVSAEAVELARTSRATVRFERPPDDQDTVSMTRFVGAGDSVQFSVRAVEPRDGDRNTAPAITAVTPIDDLRGEPTEHDESRRTVDGHPSGGDIADSHSRSSITDAPSIRGENGRSTATEVREHGHRSDPASDQGLSSGPRANTRLLGPNSDEDPVLSVVIPTMNEVEGIGGCIDDVVDALDELAITGEVIVSDSSDDRTPDVALERGAIVVEPKSLGYGTAYLSAFDHVRGDYVAIGDADMTYDFTDLPRLLAPVVDGEADFVLGSRFDGEIAPGAMPPLHRYVGNPLLTKLLNVLYGMDVSDAHSGFRVIRRDALDSLDLGTGGMEFASEMLIKAAVNDLTIEEVPITYRPRVGEPKIESVQDGWRHVKFLLLNAPAWLFIRPGSLLFLVGVALLSTMVLPGGDAGLSPIATLTAGTSLSVGGFGIVSLGIFTRFTGSPVRPESNRLWNWLVRHADLRRAGLAGVLVCAVGLGTLIAGSLSGLPVAGTAGGLRRVAVTIPIVMIGVQMIFAAFFVEFVRDQRGHDCR